MSFARLYRVGDWFCFFRSALRLAVITCVVLTFHAQFGWSTPGIQSEDLARQPRSPIPCPLVLHGDGRRSPASPRYQNNDQPTQKRTSARSSAGLRNEIKPNTITINPRTTHNNPTHSETQAASSKRTHTWRTYTGMRPNAPGHQ